MDPIPRSLHSSVPSQKQVMVDPVILRTRNGTEFTYERSAIDTWFGNGNNIDPRSGETLAKVELRPNNSLRESIEEWAALNDVIQIRAAKQNLLSVETEKQIDALKTVFELCDKNPHHKAWIGAEGCLETIVDMMKTSRRDLNDVKHLSLDAVIMLVTDNDYKKEIFADAGGLRPVVNSIYKKHLRTKASTLLEELSKNATVCGKIPEVSGSILSIVIICFQNGQDPEVAKRLRFVLEKLTEKDENVVAMARASFFEPLIRRLSTGSDASKLCMADCLASITVNSLCEENKMLLAEGAIIPLVRMCKSGKIRAKMAALGTLSNFSSCSRFKTSVAAAGAIPVVLELQVSLMYPLELRERAASVVANLCSGNSIKNCIDADKGFLLMYQAVEPFFHFEEVSSSVMRLHVLRALLGMAQEKEARQLIRTSKGIPLLLSLLSSSDSQACNCAARLVYYLSEEAEGALEIADEIEMRKTAGKLVNLLGEKVDPYAQAAAAGIMANLPCNCQNLKNQFVANGVVPALIPLVASNNADVQENAVGALRHFTDPSDVETQKAVANLDIHPLLVKLLLHTNASSPRTKTRSAQVLRNFSSNTFRLVAQSKEPMISTRWNCLRRPRHSLCRVHDAKCSVTGTFCLVEAGAVGPLVSLLAMYENTANWEALASATVEALETLVVGIGREVNPAGVMVLHETQGIQPLFKLLAHGSPSCIDRALQLLGHIFKVWGMKELYGQSARIALVAFSDLPNSSTTRKLSRRILALLEVGV